MEYYEIAAKWWADKLRHVGPGNFDMGEDGIAGLAAMMLGTINAKNNQPSNEAIDSFEKRLAETIKEKMEELNFLYLSVDYAPDHVLSTIAEETGVTTDGFPWKTSMWINYDHVEVSCGYGAKIVTIFPEKSVKKKAI